MPNLAFGQPVANAKAAEPDLEMDYASFVEALLGFALFLMASSSNMLSASTIRSSSGSLPALSISGLPALTYTGYYTGPQ